MEEIYNTVIWKDLEKNAFFCSKYNEIINQSLFYANDRETKIYVNDNKLIIAFRSKVINRENNCQFIKEAKYELFLDKNDNLIINELSGTLRSNYGYDLKNSDGGVLDTHYSCEVYDQDGVELAYQTYSDTYNINQNDFGIYCEGFLPVIEGTCNPNLVSYANSSGIFLHPIIVGDNARFTRQIRSKDNLGIVILSKCGFDKLGKVDSPKEEYYFNTFISNNVSTHPECISITRGYPFDTIDENHAMKFNELYTNSGLTPNNYQDVANDRFLKELQAGKNEEGRHVPKEILDKYDLMIEKLENRNKTLKRTL